MQVYKVYKGKVCSVSVAGCSCVAPFISTERLFSILSVNVWEHATASDVLENNYTCALMHCYSGRPDNISGIRDVSATGIFREIRGTRLTFLCKSREVFGYFDTTPESPPLHPPHTAFKNLFNEAEYTKKSETDALLKESAARNIMRKSLILLSIILRVEDMLLIYLLFFSIDKHVYFILIIWMLVILAKVI